MLTKQRAHIVLSARQWLGTPYVHQASCRGAGCDCLGLVRGVWRDLYGEEPETTPAYAMDADEWRGEGLLRQVLERYFEPTDKIALGSVLLFRWRSGLPAKHLGILCRPENDHAPAKFIHAQNVSGVSEAWLDANWQRRLCAVFDFPTPNKIHPQFEEAQ